MTGRLDRDDDTDRDPADLPRSGAELLRGDSLRDRDREAVVDVLEVNALTVHVFQHCQPTLVGMSGELQGISALEIRAALELLDIPRPDWPDTAAGVTYMGRVGAAARAELRPHR
jgi:hypothetical protein